ncbi:hypothetical protein RAS1_30900 [Phycisphaerae bacterium RAS1]|nr:hypothetical protein RAS1_30900 [Phycisphaerae bacterium RAS1]
MHNRPLTRAPRSAPPHISLPAGQARSRYGVFGLRGYTSASRSRSNTARTHLRLANARLVGEWCLGVAATTLVYRRHICATPTHPIICAPFCLHAIETRMENLSRIGEVRRRLFQIEVSYRPDPRNPNDRGSSQTFVRGSFLEAEHLRRVLLRRWSVVSVTEPHFVKSVATNERGSNLGILLVLLLLISPVWLTLLVRGCR